MRRGLQLARNGLMIAIIIFLVIINWFIFHDFFKGEYYTVPEYLTGFVSILIIIYFLSAKPSLGNRFKGFKKN